MLDEVVPYRACALFIRQTDDQGDAYAFFVEELFAAQVADAVVRPQEDRGRVQASRFLEIRQDSSDFFIGLYRNPNTLPSPGEGRGDPDSKVAGLPVRDRHGFSPCGSFRH